MVNVTIDGVRVSVEENTTIMDAAAAVGVRIPRLCYLKDINEIAACRVCLVEVDGHERLLTSCNSTVTEGMVIHTNSPRVRQARRTNVQLILSQHDCRCAVCVRSGNCSLQQLANDMGCIGNPYGEKPETSGWNMDFPLIRDNAKCIKCMRCIQVCDKVQNLGVWDVMGTGSRTTVNVANGRKIEAADCSLCGQCITHCPVAALRERDDTDRVWDALADPTKFVVVQPAPAVRVALGEEFGLPIGTRVTGKMTQALHRLGFDKVFDTDFGADLTIMEEATELLGRIQNGGVLPMFTSCSPGWVKYLEHHFPEMIPNMSTCKSPMEMEGAIIKTYYAQKAGIDPSSIVVVAVMPCTSKKFEAQRPEMEVNGLRAVDISLTTRELARMIHDARIDFVRLPDEECFDELVAQSTGAAPIFGATGGVMEAALRTAADVLEKRSVENVEYHEVRGLAGIKEATFTLGGKELKVAVASSTGAAKELIQRIKAGDASYAFVEVMACPGGCVNGGGQPIVSAYKRMDLDPREKRAAGLYAEDESKVIRKSHENPDIKKLYEEFLGKPNSHLAHRLLHTEYTDRN